MLIFYKINVFSRLFNKTGLMKVTCEVLSKSVLFRIYLTGFLNAILEESLDAPITSLQLDDPHLHKSYEDDKLSILDLLATLDNGTQVNIEIQLRNTHDMVKRALYYWSKLYTSKMQEGMPYRSLRKTINISN